MIHKIVLENFMAHARTELELGPGVTALTGPNNTGKSAVVEALRCVAANPTPKHYIRHGAKETRVTVELDDGVKVVWIRKKRSAGYEIHRPGEEEPQEYWKLGRGVVPDDVRDVLKLDPVVLEGGESIDVHIGNQREPVFLLNMPDRAVADFLASSTEGAHLLSMQGVLKRRVLEAKKDVAGREARIQDIESELDTLSPLPGLSLLAERARELEERLTQLEREIPALENFLKERTRLAVRKAQLQKVAEVLETAQEPPALNPVASLRDNLAGQAHVRGALERSGRVARVVSQIFEPPQIQPTRPIMQMKSSLEQAAAGLDRAKKRGVAMQELSEPPQPAANDRLASAVEALRKIEETRRFRERELAAAGQELEDFRTRIEERMQSMGSCPVCGNSLSAEHFLEDGGCSHD